MDICCDATPSRERPPCAELMSRREATRGDERRRRATRATSRPRRQTLSNRAFPGKFYSCIGHSTHIVVLSLGVYVGIKRYRHRRGARRASSTRIPQSSFAVVNVREMTSVACYFDIFGRASSRGDLDHFNFLVERVLGEGSVSKRRRGPEPDVRVVRQPAEHAGRGHGCLLGSNFLSLD